MKTSLINAFLRRFFGLLMISLLIVLALSEGFYFLTRSDSEREPETFEVTIPAGTAERIAAGESGPEIPNTVFVVGDTLTVHNLDSTSHELGPIWLPPGTSGSLTLGEANDFIFNCYIRIAWKPGYRAITSHSSCVGSFISIKESFKINSKS